MPLIIFFFFFNDTATTEIYTLSLHDALPIWKLWRANSGNSGTVCRSRQCLLQIQMTRPPGGSIEVDEASTLQDSIQNGGRQILVVQHLSPRAERLVRGENHRPLLEVAMVHHMVQHIGGIGSVR